MKCGVTPRLCISLGALWELSHSRIWTQTFPLSSHSCHTSLLASLVDLLWGWPVFTVGLPCAEGCALCHLGWGSGVPGFSSHTDPAACLPCPPVPTQQQQGTVIPYKLLYLVETGLTTAAIPVFEHSQASTEPVCPWLTTSSGPV